MLEKRPFATGSKPGPDEIDHYLEEQGYYRKHVARDSSSLFRVISEHVLDIQNYHDQVRQSCASYMEQHRRLYSSEIDQNFFNYISALRKTRTPGTLLELRVLAQLYKKNVILFEPNQSNTQTSERRYVNDDSFDTEPIRVFYSQRDKHFDVIYTLEYVQRLAECQAFVYECLYTNVFKLPDVKYAVERMLHDQKGEVTVPLADDESKYITANGEIIPFDGPEETCCVLKDPITCHFHNQTNFEEVVAKNQDSFTLINRSVDGQVRIYKPTDGYLYDSTKSCVRQLLDENITPFPYKVAKALDPSIYRNTEFEFWQELRKESRLKWQDVEKNENYFLQCSPLDETTYMTLDEEGKKKYFFVGGKDDEKKFGLFTGFDHFRPPRDALEPIVMPMHHQQTYNPRSWRAPRQARYYNNNQRHHNYANEDRDFQYIEQEQVYTPQPIQQNYQEHYQYVPYVDPNSPPPVYQPMQTQMVSYVPQSHYGQQPVAYQPAPTFAQPQQAVAYPNFSVPPPQIVAYPPIATPIVTTNGIASGNTQKGDYMNLIRENELSATNINWNPKESIDANGNDLPMNDMATLQFFFNLGVRYYFAAGVQRKLENVVNHMEALEVQEGQGDSLRADQPPPVPTNTPVTTKGPNSFGPPGNRSHHGNSQYNYRRAPFGNQNTRNDRDHGNQQKDNNNNGGNNNKGGRGHFNGFTRKEIQFNSNVKNVHKADSSFQKHNNGQNQSSQGSSSQTSTSSGNNSQHNILSSHSAPVTSNTPTTPSGNTETATTSNDQPAQSTLPALTIPPPQVQLAYTPAPTTPYYQQPYQQYQQPYPQYQPVQTYSVPQQQTYTMALQNENGEVMQVPAGYHPVYYTPQTPVFYQQPQVLDQSAATNDSGVETAVNGYAQTYAQPTYQYMYQPSPTQFYYAQTPLVPTTQPAANVTPVYPTTPAVVANGNSDSATVDGSPNSSSPPLNSDDTNTSETAEA